MPKNLNRRDFLGLAGLSAIAGGIACGGGVVGYLALRYITRPAPSTNAAAVLHPTPARTDHDKQIERPPIVSRGGWRARPVNHQAQFESGFYSEDNVEGWREYGGDLRAIYKTLVVHHAALEETSDLATMQRIQNEHMDKRKWSDIGYHFGVGLTGKVYEGRDLQARGTHVERFNTGSVGVVFFGNFEERQPTLAQIDAGCRLIDWLALRLELTHLATHAAFNDFTKCPGANLMPHIEMLASSAGLLLGTGGYEPPPEQL